MDKIPVKKSTLQKIIKDFTAVKSQFWTLKAEYKKLQQEFVNGNIRRAKQADVLLEQSKDFHLQHLVDICESTKLIINIITEFSNESGGTKQGELPKVLEEAMKEVLNLQKHLMRFTIDCYKTHKTDATTIELYGDFNDSQPGQSIQGQGEVKLQEKFRKGRNASHSDKKKLPLLQSDKGSDHNDIIEHHIAQNSSSDEIFLDDDEDESFSSLIPESAKDSNIEEIKLNSNFKLKSSEKENLEDVSYTELMAVSNISKETKTSGMTAKLRRLIQEDYKIFRKNKAKELDSMRSVTSVIKTDPQGSITLTKSKRHRKNSLNKIEFENSDEKGSPKIRKQKELDFSLTEINKILDKTQENGKEETDVHHNFLVTLCHQNKNLNDHSFKSFNYEPKEKMVGTDELKPQERSYKSKLRDYPLESAKETYDLYSMKLEKSQNQIQQLKNKRLNNQNISQLTEELKEQIKPPQNSAEIAKNHLSIDRSSVFDITEKYSKENILPNLNKPQGSPDAPKPSVQFIINKKCKIKQRIKRQKKNAKPTFDSFTNRPTMERYSINKSFCIKNPIASARVVNQIHQKRSSNVDFQRKESLSRFKNRHLSSRRQRVDYSNSSFSNGLPYEAHHSQDQNVAGKKFSTNLHSRHMSHSSIRNRNLIVNVQVMESNSSSYLPDGVQRRGGSYASADRYKNKPIKNSAKKMQLKSRHKNSIAEGIKHLKMISEAKSKRNNRKIMEGRKSNRNKPDYHNFSQYNNYVRKSEKFKVLGKEISIPLKKSKNVIEGPYSSRVHRNSPYRARSKKAKPSKSKRNL
ncbi:unnamed protein product [Moneuplotes crassus]|uniref:Uncharacterized protein n=2 Tax=Euplotes crassus TaxID=5936 RepID=A0AAD1XWC5_EUPCR|nr:unnamed protein product [Moneuplotes crassus]